MTCGIYLLRFEGTDRLYVGQSKNIESRYLNHLSDLRRDNSSIKLQQAYKIYGKPILEILIECTEAELDANENEAIQIFNSFNNGLNSLEHAEDMPAWKSQLKGEDGGTAVYSNQQILDAAKLMCDYRLSLAKVAELTSINYATIRKISQGIQHRWIEEKYPEIWKTLHDVRELRNQHTHSIHGDSVRHKFTAKTQGIVYPKVVSPTGEVYQIDNLSEFCKKFDLQRPNMRKMFKGLRNSHKGWKVYSEGERV